MAGDAAFPSNITYMITLFFSLLLAFHFAMAVPENTLTSSNDDAKKRNNNNDNMVAGRGSRNEAITQNLKNNITPEGIHVPDLPKGRRNSKAPRPSLKWKNKIFNASEHEVPSGPNPISNR